MSTGRNEDQIEIRGIKKTPSAFKANHNISQDDRDDIEESNSLKPSTKEDPKFHKAKTKVMPEGNVNDSRRKSFKKKRNYLNVSQKEMKEEYNISD